MSWKLPGNVPYEILFIPIFSLAVQLARQYPGVFAAFLLVFLGVFLLFAACAFFLFFLGFPCFCYFSLFFAIFPYVPSEQPVVSGTWIHLTYSYDPVRPRSPEHPVEKLDRSFVPKPSKT